MSPQVMLYGATGYSLGLAAQEAKRTGVDFILGGRSLTKVSALAHSLDVPFRIFSPTDSLNDIDAAFSGLKLFVNGAGPFQETTGPFMDACIRNGVHYIDISAQLSSFQEAERRDGDAKKAGVMLLPAGGAGIEVILDCLAGRVLERTPSPVQLDHVLNINGPLSRGTVATIRSLPAGAVKRVDGKLVPYDTPTLETFDFGDGRGSLPCFPSNDPQIITLWKAVGVPNISTMFCITGGGLPDGELDTLPIGPSAAERTGAPYHIAAMTRSADGTVRCAVAHLLNGYDLVTVGTVEAVKKILGDQSAIKPGFQTPYLVFGSEYLDVFPRTEIVES